MKTILVTIAAVFTALLQFVAFFVWMPFAAANTMYKWRTWRAWHATRFNCAAAAHTIVSDFMQWRWTL